MLFASMGLFGVFLFLTYYLQEILRFSPVKTGIAFLPMIAALAGMAQVSNRVLLPRLGPKVISADRAAHERRCVVPPASSRAPQLVREPRAALTSCC